MRRYFPLLLIVALLGSLAVSQAAGAASSPPASPVFPHPTLRDFEPEEEFEEADEEFEVEECGAPAEEIEFGEMEEAEAEEFEEAEAECGEEEGTKPGAGFVTAPAACLVRRAESTITTLPTSDRVRLTVSYLTYSPTTVTVSLKLKDHKGKLAIEHVTKHLGAKGVLHLTTKLDEAAMDRVDKAQEFDVALRAPNTPGYCGNLLEQRLRSKQPVGKARVYTEPVAG